MKEICFLPHRDLNHCCLEPKVSALPVSYADPFYALVFGPFLFLNLCDTNMNYADESTFEG